MTRLYHRLGLVVVLCAAATSAVQVAESDVSVQAVLVQAPAANADLIVDVKFNIPANQYVYAAEDHFFRVEVLARENLGTPRLVLPPSREIVDALSDEPGAKVRVFTGASTVRLQLASEGGNGDRWRIAGEVGFQACSDTTCFRPQTVPFQLAGVLGADDVSSAAVESAATLGAVGAESDNWREIDNNFTVAARTTGYQPAAQFREFLKSGVRGEQSARSVFETLEGKAGWWIVLLVLVGGLLLNLTPCVLPMIPINIAIIGAGARSGSKARGFALGAVYGLAIALVYGAGGAAVAYTGSTFGTLNASPWFNGVVAVIFLLLALAMFDVFHIDFSKFSSGLGMQKLRRGSFGLAMFMGAVAALLAGACVAPVVIAVIVFAAKEYAEGNTLALLLPFVLGLGMALPWPFAGMGLAVLPKPGAWMEKVRYVFAAFVLVLALYYGHLTFSLFRGQKTVPDAAAMVEDGWLHSLPEALRTAREQNKPVLVDFWATWCKNCMFMDRTTLVDPEVQAELRNFVLLKYQAENPNAPATAEVMNYFDVLGLPTYLILQPRMGGRQEEP